MSAPDPSGYPRVHPLEHWEFMPTPGAPWRSIQVPGCWEAQGYAHDLAGPVVYRTRLDWQPGWAGRSVALVCEAASYACTIWLDHRKVGTHEGMWDAFECDLTPYLAAGAQHELRIEIEKPGGRYPIREIPAGFLPDLGVLFGGLWQPVSIRTRGPLAIRDVQIQATLSPPQVQIQLSIAPATGADAAGQLHARLRDATGALITETGLAASVGSPLALVLPVTAPRAWEPEDPYRYMLEIDLESGGVISDRIRRAVGLRDLAISGHQVLLNGWPIYLRGVLSWGYWPGGLTPAADDDAVRAELLRLRAMGFNLLKHCLYVPPRRQLEIADELGMLTWLELPVWLPRMTPAMRARMLDQLPRIAAQRQGHPGLVICTLGCELNSSVDAPLLAELFARVRAALPGVLLRDNSGSGECYGGLATDVADFYDYHFYGDLQFYPALLDSFAAPWRPVRPWLFGEFNDIDAFRDHAEIVAAWRQSQPPGGAPLPWWLDPARDWSDNPHIQRRELPIAHQPRTLARAGFRDDPQALRSHSNETARIVRKTLLERVRTYPQICGYVVTGLRDTPISSAGLFDDLGRERIPAEELRRFNADVVLTLAWDLRRSWVHGGDRIRRLDPWNYVAGDTIRPHLVVANHGRTTLGGTFHWQLRDDTGTTVLAGAQPTAMPVPPGHVQEVGFLELPAPVVAAPTQLTLAITLGVTNQWTLWVAPPPRWEALRPAIYGEGELAEELAAFWPGVARGRAALATRGPVVATRLTDELRDWLHRGGRAVLLVGRGDPGITVTGVPFWRECHTEVRAHAAWAGFTRETVPGLQLYATSSDCALDPAAVCGALHVPPAHYTALLTRTDTRTYRQLDYAATLQLGAGQAIITTLRVQGGLGDQPTGLAHNRGGQLLLWSWLSALHPT